MFSVNFCGCLDIEFPWSINSFEAFCAWSSAMFVGYNNGFKTYFTKETCFQCLMSIVHCGRC